MFNLKIYENYYVPPCPSCGSERTGRYIQRPHIGMSFQLEQAVKAGEIVRVRNSVPENNAFCLACGHTWPCNIKIRYLSKKEIEEERIRRGTEDAYLESIERRKSALIPQHNALWNLFTKKKDRRTKERNIVPSEPNIELEETSDFSIVDHSKPANAIELLYVDRDAIRKYMQMTATDMF